MTTKRMFRESSEVSQGEDEAIKYYFDTLPWGGTPTSIVVEVFDVTDPDTWVNVTSTVMPTNSPTVVGNVVTLSHLRALTDAHIYRIEVAFTSNGNEFEAYGIIVAGE